MQPKTDKSFDDLVRQYLGEALPPPMAGMVRMANLSAEAQDFIVRMLALMQRAGYPASAFNPPLIRWLSETVPGSLPGAWGGRIPPLTVPGRHTKLDAYIAARAAPAGSAPPVFFDIGCGFPPLTSADTADRFKDWQIYGIDRAFADYVLYDADGHYACFGGDGAFQYFQALMNASGRALYADPRATRERFTALFEELAPQLTAGDNSRSETVERNGSRLIRHHILDFERANLTFVRSDLADIDLPPARAIRCMNVLIYYEPAVRDRMLQHAAGCLEDGGLLIAGTNGLGVQTRYGVYRKTAGELRREEFAFGLDNVGSIVFMPFFTIHDNDPEAGLLAELAGILRADDAFWTPFSQRQDALLKMHGLCRRESDGFWDFPENAMSPADYLQINARIWNTLQTEGYVDGAVEALIRAGYEAFENVVGDVAIRPARD
jgi:hypothetical protein